MARKVLFLILCLSCCSLQALSSQGKAYYKKKMEEVLREREQVQMAAHPWEKKNKSAPFFSRKF